MKELKKGFSLFELIIVIIIFSIAMGFIFIKTDLLITKDTQNNLSNIKQKLLNKNFEKNISLKCTNEKKCFLYIDEELQDEKITLKIDENIEVYKYNNNFTQIYFKNIEPKELESYNVIFELTINRDKKHNEMIILNEDRYYLFNSIYKRPLIFDSQSEISDYFEELKEEVKNSAF